MLNNVRKFTFFKGEGEDSWFVLKTVPKYDQKGLDSLYKCFDEKWVESYWFPSLNSEILLSVVCIPFCPLIIFSSSATPGPLFGTFTRFLWLELAAALQVSLLCIIFCFYQLLLHKDEDDHRRSNAI